MVELVGREAELALVADRLADRRLVTLVGPGGIGKTALARAAVAHCAGRFPEGAHVVDLTRVDAAAAVPESLAAQLGYASFGALLDAPGDHAALVLVDNCEHVLDAVADAVDSLLEACEMPTVLATSRSALEVPGETLVPIGPLGLPPAGTSDAPAVRLFVARARDAGAALEADDAVAELVRRLDGVPLAIELAAARARSLAPTEVLTRLGGGLDVLDRPRRRGARRHQSLRAAIGWSYDLLGEDEQALFDRLAVVPGPFTAALAHAVAAPPGATLAATQDLLDRLVAASMLAADPTGPVTWYRQLETLRTYGRDRLDAAGPGERRAVEARWVGHVVDQVAGIVTRGSATWSSDVLAELLALYDNVTGALRWCMAHDPSPDRAFLLVAAMWGVVHQAHTAEVGRLARQALDRWPAGEDALAEADAGAGSPFRADAVATAATCLYMGGEYREAVALAVAALPAAEASPYAPATLRRAIAQATRAGGDTAGALRWFARAADAARARGMVAMAVESDAGRGQVLADLGRVDEGLALVRAAHAEAVGAGSPVAAAWARAVEGSILLRSDVDRAVAVLDEALAEARRLGHGAGVSACLRALALAALVGDDLATAAGRTLELLEWLLAAGSTSELRLVFDVASVVLGRAGRRDEAADLAATALSLPVVSITASVGHELFRPDPAGGRVLPMREAIVRTRAALAALAHGAPVPAPVPPASAAPAAPAAEPTALFRRDGDVWQVAYGGEATTVRTSKGMADLARLLATPGREVHCLELAGSGLAEDGTGEVLDATARRAYEERLRELQADLDDAEDAHDLARAERTRAHIDTLVDHLTAALGLGGRSRRAAGAAERARSTVTQRIRSTIRHLDATHPRLARHLRASVQTGTFCSYTPESPVDWRF